MNEKKSNCQEASGEACRLGDDPENGESGEEVATVFQARLKKLELVIALERKLRRDKQNQNIELSAKLARLERELAKEFAEVSTRNSLDLGSRSVVDDDATVLASGLDPDATRLFVQTKSLTSEALASATASRQAIDAVLALPVGSMLHEYRIDSVLGQGGFGITYLATDINLNAKVAVKEYLPGELALRASDKSIAPRWPEDRETYQSGLENFLIEARTLATFRHPNIVRVARFFEANHSAYIVLEYEIGKSLREWWPAHNKISEGELITLLAPLLDGLAAVHDAGYLHRDIKPDNVYVRREDGSLVLLDFGAARQTVGDVQKLANIVTPGYAPQEQYEAAEQGPWTDIYAFGATLYWMISGRKPPAAPLRLDGSETMVAAKEVAKDRYTPEFLGAIDWALRLDPNERPKNILEFRRELFAAHAASLGLQEALRAGEVEAAATEGWRALANSPRLLIKHVLGFGRALVHPTSWPIGTKMIIMMVFAALVPMLITAKYNLSGSVATVSQAELAELEQLAQSSAGRITQLLEDNRHLADYLGTDPSFIKFLRKPDELAKTALNDRLNSLMKVNPNVHLVMVMDQLGTVLVASDPEIEGRNFIFRDYFQSAMNGRPYTSGFVVGAVTGNTSVFYSNPVRDDLGNVIGAVVLSIKAQAVSAILAEIRREGVTPFLIDGDGVLIYYPDKTKLYHSLVPLSQARQASILDDQRFHRDSVGDLNMQPLAAAMIGTQRPGNISYRSTISGDDEIAGYAPVVGHDWVVGVSEPRRVFEASLNHLFTNVLYSTLLVGLVFLILAVFFARGIVRPIGHLMSAVQALKEGEYEQANIKVTSGDELGKLGRTFNVMIDVLRQRDREFNIRQAARRAENEAPDQ